MQGGTDPWRWQRELHSELGPMVAARSHGGLEDVRTPLLDALGARLSASVSSPEDLPSTAISAMDGFAVCSRDLTTGTSLRLIGELTAATAPAGTGPPVTAGEAVRIMTGAPLPVGADCVVPWEQSDAEPGGDLPETVRLLEITGLGPGRHVRSAGEEISRGAVLAPEGQVVGPALVGLAATLGIPGLPVAGSGLPSPESGPLVAVVVTGDEVVPGDTLPSESRSGAVRDSNGLLLAAALRAHGARSRLLRSSDDPEDLRSTLHRAEDDAALVLTTGGVGRGSRDVVRGALGPTGAGTSRFSHLSLRPGAPQGWGILPGGVPVVHLPGTPVGAFVGFQLFVAPLLGGPLGAQALESVTILGPPGRTRSRQTASDTGTWRVLPGRWDDRGGARIMPGSRLAPYAWADSLLILEPGSVSRGSTALLRQITVTSRLP